MSFRSPLLVALTTLVLLGACARVPVTAPGAPSPSDSTPPTIRREMRGLWIASVANIDWPSKPGLSADQQRAELAGILDRAASLGLNAVILQVRPAADAVYASTIEPWASMLTGTQGAGPGYDPLAYAVTEAHARGLELHAWINPYRAGSARDTASLAATHLWNTRRNLVRVYGSSLWLDPGDPAVLDHSMRVVRDIVSRYDVDGVHADDYFYPYPQNDSAGRKIDFPDSATYARSGSTLSRDDWRRENVGKFVERMYREVHALKPMVKVGVSPFGIWRPGNPPSVAGLDAYAAIYADSRKWLQQGWVDYLAPQLYWAIASPQQSYPALLDWWIAQNSANRHIWPGLATYRVNSGAANAFSATEIADQVTLTRTRPGSSGNLLYNGTATLNPNGAVATSLAPLYADYALVPAYRWLDAVPPGAPTVGVSGSMLSISPATGEVARWWLVRARVNARWTTQLLFGDRRSLALTGGPDRVIVNAVDGAGNASIDAEWRGR